METRMLKVLLLSHGRLCEGMLDTLSMFQPSVEHITAIPFYVNGVDSDAALQEYLHAIQKEDTVLIFTDILMGSVNQNIMVACENKTNVHVVSGYNLPVVLELLTCDSKNLTSQWIEEKVTACKDSIVSMDSYIPPRNDGDE